MQQVKLALQQTTSHGLPRTVTAKPLAIRLAWLLLFLASMGLFLRGFIEFIAKLQSRQVTSSLETNAVPFKFPDIYACFENAVSTSYAAGMSKQTATEINRQLDDTLMTFKRHFPTDSNSTASGNQSTDAGADFEQWNSFAYVQSLQYSLLVDAMAHRLEQAVITSDVTYVNSYGLPTYDAVQADSFYHPVHLRCIRWKLNDTFKATLAKSGTSGGLVVTLLTDANFSATSPKGPALRSRIFARGTQIPIPVSDWSLSRLDFDDPDRKAGVRVYLCPPGEYPTAFVKSFSLGPGRHHTVEIGMTEQVYSSSSFDCISDPPQVQFVNPYNQEPSSHTYSYSYCYFYEYHKQYQAITNLSGDASPLPWPLRGRRYLFNLTGEDNFLQLALEDPQSGLAPDSQLLSRVSELAQTRCQQLAPCATVHYEATASSADWPTYSSVGPFVAATVGLALGNARSKNLSVPALEYLASQANATEAAAVYVGANLVKVSFRALRADCSRVSLSRDYGLANFVSDVGGIMGIYLGMSLLTLVEIFELLYDLASASRRSSRGGERPREAGIDDVPPVAVYGNGNGTKPTTCMSEVETHL